MRHNRLPLKHSVEKKWEGGGGGGRREEEAESLIMWLVVLEL